MKIARRDFIVSAGMAGIGATSLACLVNRAALSGDARPLYGPLQPTKSNNTNETVLALPEGFQYTVIGKTGAKMSDGHATPAKHDGMAAFQVGTELRLVRNHEVTNSERGIPGSAIGPNPYDTKAGGGTTTLIIDPHTRELVKDFVSLSGTLINCAGGPTPWGSWISCEETVRGRSNGFEQSHGYCFEVPAAANAPITATPLKAMGRFKHEAVAADPATKTIYLTEDVGDPIAKGGFYRFLPSNADKLQDGGRLQMLKVTDKKKYDTRMGQKVGVGLPVTWVDIKDPDPREAETNSLAVYQQGFELDGTTFGRLEGCFHGNGRIYFDATSAGDKYLGQIWEYAPQDKDQGVLTLLYESSNPAVLNRPDNICFDSSGNLIICEDNGRNVHLRIMTPQGEISELGRNVYRVRNIDYSGQEFAGVTLSPDFKTLFVNIQTPGLTLAIWGPW
ncbi:MAG TPA: alkaline phosphatase PhoX [Pyrinomonadaceae bacterium]|nr:alkaline phosphatase PhoX [Pyrinomonadaceae bacterium]